MTAVYYKVLGKYGVAPRGRGLWHLPVQDTLHPGEWQPGEWMPAVEGYLEFCVNGYHATTLKHLPGHLCYGPLIGVVEYDGAVIVGSGEVIGRKARLLRLFPAWDERAMRLFACDCAERVVHIIEQAHPDDLRPREAIGIVRRFANGQATKEELAAARAAAWDATRAGMPNAAWAAARRDAWTAADAAAWSARVVAWPERAVEREWQAGRLLEYLNGTVAA